MVNFATPIKPSPPHWNRDSQPVVFAPLDEPTAYRILDAYFEREAEKQALAALSRMDDNDVLSVASWVSGGPLPQSKRSSMSCETFIR